MKARDLSEIVFPPPADGNLTGAFSLGRQILKLREKSQTVHNHKLYAQP